MLQDVEAFHRKFNFPENVDFENQREFREDLDTEEELEFWHAINANDKNRAALELADRIFVLLGHAIQWGLDLEHAWHCVTISNMLKEPNPNGGKPVKPDHWISSEELFMGRGNS